MEQIQTVFAHSKQRYHTHPVAPNRLDREEARQAIFEYIEVFYNRQRTYSALDYTTPVQYEQQFEHSLTVH